MTGGRNVQPHGLGVRSFGSLPADRLVGFLVVCGEVVERCGRAEAAASDEGEGSVAQGGEDLGCCAGAGSPLILSPGDIAHRMQAVVDPQMGARRGEQACTQPAKVRSEAPTSRLRNTPRHTDGAGLRLR